MQQPAPSAPAVPVRAPQPVSRPSQPASKRPQQRPQPVPKRLFRAPKQKQRQAYAPVEPAPGAVRSPIRRERIPQGQDRESLKVRRRRERRRVRRILIVVTLLIIIGAISALWWPAIRIQNVQASGPDQQGVQQVAEQNLWGAYYYVFPRNSIFFFPSEQIRSQILAAYPDISAVSIHRTSFSSIQVASIPRESAFIWCGENYTKLSAQATQLPVASSTSTKISSSTVGSVEPQTDTSKTCYNADGQGFIFSASQNNDPNTFHIYGSLMNPGASPIGSKMANANSIPAALNFVKALRDMSVPTISLVIRGDEADLYTPAGTRITYVLGKEQAAESLAQAAFKDLNLNDGSLEYVDLRFDSKVYFKKVGAAASSGT